MRARWGVARGGGGSAGPQMRAQPLGDERQSALGLQFVTGVTERGVQLADAPSQYGVTQVGPVHRGPDEVLAQMRAVEIDDALAETVRGGRGAVVRDVRRQQGHRVVRGAVLVPVQVVPYGPVVDDEQRPGLVHVHRIGVLGEVGVEDLHDTRNARAPGGDLRLSDHAKNVQDGVVPRSAVSIHEQ